MKTGERLILSSGQGVSLGLRFESLQFVTQFCTIRAPLDGFNPVLQVRQTNQFVGQGMPRVRHSTANQHRSASSSG